MATEDQEAEGRRAEDERAGGWYQGGKGGRRIGAAGAGAAAEEPEETRAVERHALGRQPCHKEKADVVRHVGPEVRAQGTGKRTTNSGDQQGVTRPTVPPRGEGWGPPPLVTSSSS